MLAYPSFEDDFVLETDASIEGLGAILSQYQQDGLLHPVSYASRALSPAEKNYSITELETLAVVWAMSHFQFYLYGHSVTVYTDHSAVTAILNCPTPTGKHARWWLRVYAQGIRDVKIIHRSGRSNANADALSRNPPSTTSTLYQEEEVDPGVSAVNSTDLSTLLEAASQEPNLQGLYSQPGFLASEQRKDHKLRDVFTLLEQGDLPDDDKQARKLLLQQSLFTIVDSVLYKVDPRHRSKQVVVPQQLCKELIQEHHRGKMGGHFSADRTFKSMALKWWWEGMYQDITKLVSGCPECSLVSGGGEE